jgi:SAM-dependent methyltransferase
MTFEEYFVEVKQEPHSSCINLDPVKEAKYMQDYAYRFNRTLRAIPVSSRPLRMLDIGTTPFTMFLKYKFPHYDVCTLDRTDLLKERCRAAGIGLVSSNLDEGTIPVESGQFDIVIFTEVLEHVFFPPTKILSEIRRVLHTSGKLVLSVPNIATLGNRIKLICGRTPLQHPDAQLNRTWVHGHGHLHEYTRDEIVSLCRGAGLAVVNCEMLGVPVVDVLRTARRSFGQLIYHQMQSIVPCFRAHIFLECQR